MSGRADVVVVGAGIVGLAAAWQLHRCRPSLRIRVLEREHRTAAHQSSHNSGVVHAGIYYAPGSRKATLCRRGNTLLEEFAVKHDIPLRRNGKLVIATCEAELPALGRLAERAHENGVPGLRLLEAGEVAGVEPAARGLRALHSPVTGVIDFAHVCRALVDDLEQKGVEVELGTEVVGIDGQAGHARVETADGRAIDARAVLVCAGLRSDDLVDLREARRRRTVPFRGAWYRMRGAVAAQVVGNVYPVPNPRLPFLGVHLTRRIDDEVWAGPNAFLSFSRERYLRWAFDPRDAASTLGFPGFWRFASRHLSAAAVELRHELSTASYAREVARYLPDVRPDDLERGPLGVRAQLLTREGEMVDDFAFHEQGPVLHVRSAPSPAATSALAIGEELASRIEDRLT